MTLHPKGPFEFWQAGFGSPSPPLIVPGKRLFSDTLKVILSADTGLWDGWNTLSCTLWEILCRQFKPLHTLHSLSATFFAAGLQPFCEGAETDSDFKMQHTVYHTEQTSTWWKRTLTWPLVGGFHTNVSLCTSEPTSPFCHNVSQFQISAAFIVHTHTNTHTYSHFFFFLFFLNCSLTFLKSGVQLSKHMFLNMSWLICLSSDAAGIMWVHIGFNQQPSLPLVWRSVLAVGSQVRILLMP